MTSTGDYLAGMLPEIVHIDINDVTNTARTIARAAALILRGELVAFPTETVYGLGANGLDPDAVARIYAAKGRPAWNPVILHVADVSAARALVAHWPERAQQLADAFWPGPLTMVLPKSASVPPIATAGGDAVAVRVPRHPVALALLRATGVPIAAPSANRFTHISPTTAQHVAASLGPRVPLILDGGPCDVGIESTVVDLAGEYPTILRPGSITAAALSGALHCDVQQTVSRTSHAASYAIAPARSPGTADRHYAPNADVWLVDASNVDEIVAALSERRSRSNAPITMLLLEMSVPMHAQDGEMRMPQSPELYARSLYAALHDADAAGTSLIVIERPPDTDAWQAVHDRLSRAAL